jgi:hypothetical protein
VLGGTAFIGEGSEENSGGDSCALLKGGERMTESAQTNVVGTIGADRVCIRCGFNLFGQNVINEPHYGLSICTCPECGQVASLQTYPLMSKWINRWRALIGTAWVVLLVFVFLLQLSLVGTYANSMSQEASMNLAIEIGKAYDEFEGTQGNTTQASSWAYMGEQRYSWLNMPTDFANLTAPGIIEEQGGVLALLDWGFMFYIIPVGIAAIVFGVFWSNALLGASRKRATLVPVLMGVIIVLLGYIPEFYQPVQGSAQVFAMEYYESFITPFGMLVQLPFILFGIFIGRSFARLIIALTLPPRLRAPFSIFWTRDGLELPRPSRT